MRKNFLPYVAAAALAINGVVYLGISQADQTVTKVTTEQITGTGNTLSPDDHQVHAIENRLGRMVNQALTKDNFDDFVGYLSKADRDRIGDAADKDYPDLDAKIDQLQQDFKAKYNESLSLGDYKNLFSGIVVRQTTDKNNASAMWSPTTISDLATGETGHGAAGMNMSKSITLNLVNEGHIFNAWRVETTGTFTGEQLKDSLIQQITRIEDAKDKWPADKADAYRFIAFNVLRTVAQSGEGGMANER